MKLKNLPLIVKVSIILTFFNTWVMFEEFVIDRFGYWAYLPFYKKGIFCTWDIAFVLIASILVFLKRDFMRSNCFITNCTFCK
jgi:hypothetical protein